MKIYKIDLIDNQKVDTKNPETIWDVIPISVLRESKTEKVKVVLWQSYSKEVNNNFREYLKENNDTDIIFEIISDFEWEVFYRNGKELN